MNLEPCLLALAKLLAAARAFLNLNIAQLQKLAKAAEAAENRLKAPKAPK